MKKTRFFLILIIILLICGCGSKPQSNEEAVPKARYLYPKDYMADPSANVFNGKVYIYPSHDWKSGITTNSNGEAFQLLN